MKVFLKRYITLLLRKKFFVVFTSIIISLFFVMGVYYFYNPSHERYSITFKSDTEYVNILNYEYVNNIKISLEEYRENNSWQENGTTKYPYSSFSYIKSKKIAKSSTLEYKNDMYTLSCEKQYFNSWQQARRFMKEMVSTSYDASFMLHDNTFVINDTAKKVEDSMVFESTGANLFLVSAIGLGIGFVLSLIIVFIFTFIMKDNSIDHILYDNVSVFKTPFHVTYLKSACKEFSTVKNLVTISILFALQLCTKFISLPSGFANLGIGLAFLVFAVIGMLYGPVVGLVIGIFSDILGFAIKPDGVFFIGYTLSAMLSGLMYGLCFYKTKITFTKCLFARIFVNLFVNSVLGTLWWWLISHKSFDFKTYMLVTELPKNLAYLIPQSLAIYVLFKALAKPLVKAQVLDRRIAENITLF